MFSCLRRNLQNQYHSCEPSAARLNPDSTDGFTGARAILIRIERIRRLAGRLAPNDYGSISSLIISAGRHRIEGAQGGEMEIQSQSMTPWLSIWISPRRTIRKIVDTDPGKFVIPLAMLAGISQALDRSVARSSGDTLPLTVVLAICLILGPIGGILSLYIGGALFRWSGSWLGGQARTEEVRAAIAWSSVPVIFILPLWIPQILIFGEELFTTATPRMDANPVLALLLLGFGLFELAVGIWAFIIFLQTLGEVHRFSAWKALAAAFLGTLVVVVPILCVVGIFLGIAGLV
jgi:hypothetical protein